MPIGGAADEDHEVGNFCEFGHRENDEIAAFEVFEGIYYEVTQRFWCHAMLLGRLRTFLLIFSTPVRLRSARGAIRSIDLIALKALG